MDLGQQHLASMQQQVVPCQSRWLVYWRQNVYLQQYDSRLKHENSIIFSKKNAETIFNTSIQEKGKEKKKRTEITELQEMRKEITTK